MVILHGVFYIAIQTVKTMDNWFWVFYVTKVGVLCSYHWKFHIDPKSIISFENSATTIGHIYLLDVLRALWEIIYINYKLLEKSMRICTTRRSLIRRVRRRKQSNPTSLVNDQATHVLGKLQDICTLLQEFVVSSRLLRSSYQ